MSVRRWVEGLSAVVERELRVAYGAPGAWVFLTAQLAFMGWFVVRSLHVTGEASLRPVLPDLAVTLVFCVPLLTMSTLASEDRRGSLELLLTAPLPLSALVVGKWLAVVAQCGVWLLLSLPTVGVLWRFGSPDLGALFTVYLGLALCCGAFASVGLFVSSVTRDALVAGVGAVALLLGSWLAASLGEQLTPGAARWLEAVSFVTHLRGAARGVLHSGEVAWFVGATAMFLLLSWRSLESRRWR